MELKNFKKTFEIGALSLFMVGVSNCIPSRGPISFKYGSGKIVSDNMDSIPEHFIEFDCGGRLPWNCDETRKDPTENQRKYFAKFYRDNIANRKINKIDK